MAVGGEVSLIGRECDLGRLEVDAVEAAEHDLTRGGLVSILLFFGGAVTRLYLELMNSFRGSKKLEWGGEIE